MLITGHGVLSRLKTPNKASADGRVTLRISMSAQSRALPHILWR